MTLARSMRNWGFTPYDSDDADSRYDRTCSDCGTVVEHGDDLVGGLCDRCRDERCCDECGDVVERYRLADNACDRCRAELDAT